MDFLYFMHCPRNPLRVIAFPYPLRFRSATCNGWLATCAFALLIEAALQQPVVLLMTGVLGDFVEESADFLFEIMQN